MEGTSGAADLGLLRGRTSDAALGGIAGKVGVSLRPRWQWVSQRHPSSDTTTGGVRADRVGAKLLREHAFGRPAAGGVNGGSHRPLARETSVGARSALSNGYVRGRKIPGDVGRESDAAAIRGRVRGASLDHETEVSIQKRLRRFTERKPVSGRKPGGGWRLRSSRAKAREASRARKRELGMLGDVGIGRFAGGARGLFVLQKSTSGVWSSTRL